MKLARIIVAAVVLASGAGISAHGQQIITGDPSVAVEGGQAARSGEATSDNHVVTGGSGNVFIGGKPAATVGDRTDCGGVVVTGSSTVYINGKPMATSGSQVAGCAN